MDFCHNPYRCGPLRVGMYAITPNISIKSKSRPLVRGFDYFYMDMAANSLWCGFGGLLFCNRIRNNSIGLYRENAIAIGSEARDPFGGNVYYVTMEITFPIPECARRKRNLHCDVVHVTTKWVSRLVLDHAIAAIQTSR